MSAWQLQHCSLWQRAWHCETLFRAVTRQLPKEGQHRICQLCPQTGKLAASWRMPVLRGYAHLLRFEALVNRAIDNDPPRLHGEDNVCQPCSTIIATLALPHSQGSFTPIIPTLQQCTAPIITSHRCRRSSGYYSKA